VKLAGDEGKVDNIGDCGNKRRFNDSMTNFRGSKSADTGHEQHFWIYSGAGLKFAFQYGVRDAHIYAYYIVHRGRYW